MSSNPDEFEVVIVGAGIAGLTAAFELRQNKPDCKLVVVEAKGMFSNEVFVTWG